MPNMFKCTLASGGALVLTVTCDSAFAGQTITCTDGTTTLTQICPSTSPYTVEFRIPNSGTWTISSGTDSTSVVIPDAIELHNIPNGSTVTPTDVIQTWLHCANIWDKNYTTISQVLSDASTLQALIASNNAADYMARSTTWASNVTTNSSAMTYIGLNDYCSNALLANSTWLSAICNSTYFESVLNVKVPTMTSNTTPSGQVFYDHASEDSIYPLWKVFDNNDETMGTLPLNTYSSTNLGYKFTNNVKVKKARLYFSASTYSRISTIKVKDSSNGTSFNDATQAISVTSREMNVPILANHNNQYWEIEFNRAVVNPVGCYGIQFYGRA